MVSFITSSNAHYLISPVVSSLGLGTNFKIRTRAVLVLVKKDRFWGFKELKKTRRRSGVLCKGSLESEAELVLEREILEFMKVSRNPNDFPTKKELLDAGRIDLVNAIIKIGGWLALGWDDYDDENELDIKEVDNIMDLHTRIRSCQQNNDDSDPSLNCSSSHQLASSSGRSLGTVDQEDAGIEGILYRLEKDRSLSFGISMLENGHDTYASSKDNGGHRGCSSADVAAEINCGEKLTRGEEDSKDKVLGTQGDTELQERHKEINSNYIISRFQDMQLELSSSLCLLRSKSDKNNPEGHKRSSNELQQLPDTREFQENEFMNTKDRLRSIRAELAVLEREMGLSIINLRKRVEEKQRRSDNGCRALHLLHYTSIIWPNSASEVLLAGSFDGWTTQ
ncbi:hypothetical protein Ccrd_000124, partial [Cynara cardunculus var. scolymus]